jgi:hypothetical protein
MTILGKTRVHTCAAFDKLRTVLFALLCFVPGAFAASATNEIVPPNRVLRTVAEIRKLSRDQARLQIPVRLNGVITYWGPRWSCFFADDTGGIFLRIQLPENRAANEPSVGDQVEVTGVTAPGDFAPLVDDPLIRKKGKGALPSAKVVSLEHLMEGQEDSQFVET